MVSGFKYSVKSKKELDYYKDTNEHEVVKELDENRSLVRSVHTWNKVKLEGTWYNVFVLADKLSLAKRDLPIMAFLSDKTYKRMGFLEQSEIGSIQHCKVDMPEYELRELFPRTKRFSHRYLQFDEDVVNHLTGEKLKSVQNEMTLTQIKDSVVAFGLSVKRIAAKIGGIKVPNVDVNMPRLPAPKPKSKAEEITDFMFELREVREERNRPTSNPEYTSLDSFNKTMRTVTDYQLKTMGIERKEPTTILDGLGGERIREENKVSWDSLGRPSIGLSPIREMSDSNPDIPELESKVEKTSNNGKRFKIIKHPRTRNNKDDKNDNSR